MKRTVKAVGVWSSKQHYLHGVVLYGRLGNHETKEGASREAEESLYEVNDTVIDCLVTFDDGTKPKKGRRK